MDKERLENIRKLANNFADRKVRAAARLAEIKGRMWYFAVLGLKTNLEHFDFDIIAKLQRVIEPPGEVELAAALREKTIFSVVARYSHSIQYELAVNRDFASTDQAAFNLAWWITSALRVRTLAEILVPAVSDHSWSTIAGAPDGSCHAQLLEDVPKARRLSEPVEVGRTDFEWVLLYLNRFSELLEVPKFRLAVESLSTHNFQSSERMMAATIWAGIEALFEIQSELRFRLATLVSSSLEPRGEDRRKLYRRTKALYDVRSKAVHGSPISDAKIQEHIIEVRHLLSRLLCRFIEIGKVPNEQELEEFVFC
ncbi:MAG: hypothetical protein ACLGJB_14370 [Blastocatellia bacterium]